MRASKAAHNLDIFQTRHSRLRMRACSLHYRHPPRNKRIIAYTVPWHIRGDDCDYKIAWRNISGADDFDMGVEYIWGHRVTVNNLRGDEHVLVSKFDIKF